MVAFFPTIYDDELLYSAIARFHIRSGNTSIKSTINDLFVCTTVTAGIELPSHIEKLVKSMPLSSKYTVDDLIMGHTMFPFYSAFLPTERTERIYKSMIGNKGGDIYNSIGLMASSITENKFLKYCPECMKEDMDKYGELYWHRIHQVPAITICYKHHIPLLNSKIPFHGYNKHEYVNATEFNCINNEVNAELNSDLINKLVRLSGNAEYILNNRFESKPSEWFRKQYLTRMQQLGYANANGIVRQEQFVKDFINFYGEDFLILFQSQVDIYKDSNWLSNIIRKKSRTIHPIRHLLLIGFLNISIYDLFNKRFEYLPFGKGPWPCLNGAADHYLQPTITNVNIKHGLDSKAPLGEFSCTCGFTYTRSGPDKTEKDKRRFGRIKKFGPIWEEKLAEQIEQGLGLRAIARQLKVDPATVKKQAAKLGLIVASNKDNDNTKNNKENNSIENGMDLKRDELRNEWLYLEKQNPNKSITELRKMNNALYSRIYRIDKDWLCQNKPVKKSIKAINTRVDWEKRDLEILEKLKKTVNEILSEYGKPKRITIGFVGSKIGIRSLFEKHLDKLPNCKSYLENVKESDKDYRLRRIKWAVSELKKEGQELQRWKIIRKAGVREEYAADLEKDILNMIEV